MKQVTFKARLTKKTFRSFLVNHLTYRYKFSPAVSEVLSEDSIYLREILNPKARRDGQIIYHAVDLREPAGKALADCRYHPVKLTLRDESDIKYREEKGLKELKLLVLQRITEEAVTQGACLTHEDIATLLYLDRGTVSDYIAELRSRGIEVRTRASFTDQGRGITHRENIIKLYLQNYTETEISQRTKHVLPCVENYIDKFLRIGLCYRKGDDIALIVRTTKCSIETVKQNITLHQKLSNDPQYKVLLDEAFHFYETELIPGEKRREKMGRMTAGRLIKKKIYGRLSAKSLRSALKKELLDNFGFGNMGAIGDLLIDRFLAIIDEFAADKERMQPYQMKVVGVDKNERFGYGKSIYSSGDKGA